MLFSLPKAPSNCKWQYWKDAKYCTLPCQSNLHTPVWLLLWKEIVWGQMLQLIPSDSKSIALSCLTWWWFNEQRVYICWNNYISTAKSMRFSQSGKCFDGNFNSFLTLSCTSTLQAFLEQKSLISQWPPLERLLASAPTSDSGSRAQPKTYLCTCCISRKNNMPRIDNDIKLDFKDVLVRPKRSTLRSRADVRKKRVWQLSGWVWHLICRVCSPRTCKVNVDQ